MGDVLLLMTAAIWFAGLLGALVPLVISKNEACLSVCNSFAAGVMLAAGLVHLLGDASETLEPLSIRVNFPVANFTCALAFILIFYVEAPSRHMSHRQEMTHIGMEEGDACSSALTTKADYGATHAVLIMPGFSGGSLYQAENGGTANGKRIHEEEVDTGKTALLKPALEIDRKVKHDEVMLSTLGGSLCLLAALSFHSMIEGLGLATSAAKQLLLLFLAIICHKGLAALALGSTLLVANVSRSQFLCIVLCFSLATPMGVGLGLLISRYTQDVAINGVCAAIAAGTFLHISAIEIIPSTFRNSKTPEVLQLVSLTIGFLSMSLLRLWV